MEEISWSQKCKKLFMGGGNYHKFVHCCWGDIDTDFFAYMEGYKTAAGDLIEKAVESKNIKITDTYIFPKGG